MSDNPQSTVCSNLTNQCEICGSPLALVADQQTMLGTLECPECCCDQSTPHQFSVRIIDQGDSPWVLATFDSSAERFLFGQLSMKREATQHLETAFDRCRDFLIEQLGRKQHAMRKRGYGTNRKDRHAHFRRTRDKEVFLSAGYQTPKETPIACFSFYAFPSAFSPEKTVRCFRVLYAAIRRKLDEATKR